MSWIGRKIKHAPMAVVLLVVLLVGARLVLPTVVERYVNRTLNKIPGYRGHIGEVTISLYRGAYSIHDVVLQKVDGKIPVPLFSAPLLDLAVEWKGLLHGKVVGKIFVDHPKVNFVNAHSDQGSQLGVNDEWLSAIKNLFPLRINRFEINDGQVHFRDFESTPKVDLNVTKLQVIGENFSNTRRAVENSMARIDASALAEGKSKMMVRAFLQPAEKTPTFDVNASLETLPVASVNDFLEAYGAITAKNGTIAIYTEMTAEHGKIRGYVKPLIKDLSLLQLEQNPLKLVWQSVVALFAEVLTNQRHGQIGFKVPFEGRSDDPQIGIWSTVGSLFRNAFVAALKPGTEDAEHFEDSKHAKAAVPTPEPLPTASPKK